MNWKTWPPELKHIYVYFGIIWARWTSRFCPSRGEDRRRLYIFRNWFYPKGWWQRNLLRGCDLYKWRQKYIMTFVLHSHNSRSRTKEWVAINKGLMHAFQKKRPSVFLCVCESTYCKRQIIKPEENVSHLYELFFFHHVFCKYEDIALFFQSKFWIIHKEKNINTCVCNKHNMTLICILCDFEKWDTCKPSGIHQMYIKKSITVRVIAWRSVDHPSPS